MSISLYFAGNIADLVYVPGHALHLVAPGCVKELPKSFVAIRNVNLHRLLNIKPLKEFQEDGIRFLESLSSFL